MVLLAWCYTGGYEIRWSGVICIQTGLAGALLLSCGELNHQPLPRFEHTSLLLTSYVCYIHKSYCCLVSVHCTSRLEKSKLYCTVLFEKIFISTCISFKQYFFASAQTSAIIISTWQTALLASTTTIHTSPYQPTNWKYKVSLVPCIYMCSAQW